MLYELPVAYQAKKYAHQQHGNREYGYTATQWLLQQFVIICRNGAHRASDWHARFASPNLIVSRITKKQNCCMGEIQHYFKSLLCHQKLKFGILYVYTNIALIMHLFPCFEKSI